MTERKEKCKLLVPGEAEAADAGEQTGKILLGPETKYESTASSCR